MSTTSSDASLSDTLTGDTVTIERYRRLRGVETVCRLLAGWTVVGPPAAAVHIPTSGDEWKRYVPPEALCGRTDPHGAHLHDMRYRDLLGEYRCEGLA